MFIRKEKAMALINLPDFVTKKVDMLTAAREFKAAIDKNCKRMGMDPDWETIFFLIKNIKVLLIKLLLYLSRQDHSIGV